MTLGFSTHINENPTYFVEKILSGLHGHQDFKGFNLSEKYNIDLDIVESCKDKITTIREDSNNRWKAGNKIHFVIFNRTPNRYQFYPVVKCTSIQEIWISPFSKTFRIWREELESWDKMSPEVIEQIAYNDGFNSLKDFWNYFDREFAGKIIHWTETKY